MKRSFSLSSVIVLICLIGVGTLIYFSPIPMTQRKAEKAALSAFGAERNTFLDIVKSVPMNNSLLEILFDVENVQYMDVPDGLTESGVESIYIIDDVVYFEFHNSIMGVTPFGILHADDISMLDDWYKTKQIEDDWYYYRIVS